MNYTDALPATLRLAYEHVETLSAYVCQRLPSSQSANLLRDEDSNEYRNLLETCRVCWLYDEPIRKDSSCLGNSRSEAGKIDQIDLVNTAIKAIFQRTKAYKPNHLLAFGYERVTSLFTILLC